jgi:hypothetical protein
MAAFIRVTQDAIITYDLLHTFPLTYDSIGKYYDWSIHQLINISHGINTCQSTLSRYLGIANRLKNHLSKKKCSHKLFLKLFY